MTWFLLGLAGLVAAQAPQTQEHAGTYTQAEIQHGARVYGAQCLQCHGLNGDQVGGVDLRTGRFRDAVTDDDLRRIVVNGIPGTSMPGRKLETPDVVGVVAYIRNMRDFDAKAVVVGDATRGQVLYESKGRCATCHRVNGTGSRVAPDLSEIGLTRQAASLQQALSNPSTVMRPINRPIRAVTRDGKAINGRRLNEDTFTVQLMDDKEQLVSLVKADLRAYTILTESTMPSYEGRLDTSEMADLIAYLVSLKGKR